MTEEEWLACTDPDPMLEFLRDKASERKLRLFAVACVGRIQHLLPDERTRKGLEITTAHVDGECDDRDYAQAARDAADACIPFMAIEDVYFPNEGAPSLWVFEPGERQRCEVAYETACQSALDGERNLARLCAQGSATVAAYVAAFGNLERVRVQFVVNRVIDALSVESVANVEDLWGERTGTLEKAATAASISLLQDIFGPLPCRPVTIDPTCISSTVKELAQVIYDEQTFDRLPILADALADAGCSSQHILNHFRCSGEHVRGCWAIDLILGKE